MAITGLSKPIVADYTADGNNVTYAKILAVQKAVEYSAEVESAEDNDLYGDNVIAESAAGRFTSGSLTLKTTDFTPELSASLLGAKTATRSIGGKEVKEVVFDDDQKTTEKGFGIIEEHQIDGITTYLPIVFSRVKFNIPAKAATTRGKEIDWQTPEITGTILRSDQVDANYNHPWQISPETAFTTEADAEAYIKTLFGASAATE